jgi:hypothetical protein
MGNLPLAPLQGHNPKGVRSKDFDELAAARSFAVGIKDEWNFVTTYKRTKNGNLKKIEQYEKGRHFSASNKS